MDGIFIVGTGRTGTHFLAKVLSGFENVCDPLSGQEYPELIERIAKDAIGHCEPSSLFFRYYQDRANSQVKGVFLDQHHPNLFFVDHLVKLFPNALFLYPARPMVQTVASMMRHKGVMAWYDYACRVDSEGIPLPNQFLGIRSLEEITSLPLHQLCALRVLAHQRAAKALKAQYSDRVRYVCYESLVAAPEKELERIFSWSEKERLGQYTAAVTGNPASLDKFNSVLSDLEIRELEKIEKQDGLSRVSLFHKLWNVLLARI